MTTVENPPPTPIPVIPIKPPTRIGWALLLSIVFAGLAGCTYFMLHPSIQQETDGQATLYRVNPDQINREVLMLIVAGVCGMALGVHAPADTRYRKYGVAGLTLAVILPVVLWHHHAARITITPDSLTAPQRSQLLPGEPITVRFDQMTMLQFIGNKGDKAGTRQRCHTKDHREIEFDFGPLGDAVADTIAELAKAQGVPVTRP